MRGYGDTASNAYAQGLRRAAESHGLGRELWRMELSDEQKEIARESEPKAKPLREQMIERIGLIKSNIVELGGKVEKEDLSKMSDEEIRELGTAYKEQLERLTKSKGK